MVRKADGSRAREFAKAAEEKNSRAAGTYRPAPDGLTRAGQVGGLGTTAIGLGKEGKKGYDWLTETKAKPTEAPKTGPTAPAPKPTPAVDAAESTQTSNAVTGTPGADAAVKSGPPTVEAAADVAPATAVADASQAADVVDKGAQAAEAGTAAADAANVASTVVV